MLIADQGADTGFSSMIEIAGRYLEICPETGEPSWEGISSREWGLEARAFYRQVSASKLLQ